MKKKNRNITNIMRRQYVKTYSGHRHAGLVTSVISFAQSQTLGNTMESQTQSREDTSLE